MSDIRHQPVAPTQTEQHPAGETIGRHRHDNDQLIYVHAGVLAIHAQHGSWMASRDRAMWLPAGGWHEHRAYGPTSLTTIGFPAGSTPLPAGAPVIITVDNLLRELLTTYAAERLPSEEHARLAGVLHDRLRRAPAQPLQLPVARDPRLAAACELVSGDLTIPRSITWLAAATHTSERTLSRLFRTEFAMTYPQWRTIARIFHATIHLAQGHTVTHTAHHCGWATTSAFIDTYTRSTGHTPGSRTANGQPAHPSD